MKLFSTRHFATATILLASTGPILAGNFSVTTATTAGQSLSGGQTGTVSAAGSITTSGSTVAVTFASGAGTMTLTNNGLIKQTGSGRAFRSQTDGVTIQITNNAGATVDATGADGMKVSDSTVTLNNSGTIKSEGGQALDWADILTKSSALTNTSTGLIQATGDDAVRPGVNGSISNAGTIQAIPTATASPSPGGTSPSGSDGVDVQNNTGVQITSNSGLIEGRHGVTGGDDTHSVAISITNSVGGTLRGVNGSGINIDNGGSTATILNNGTIEGKFDNTKYTVGDGDGVDVDGVVNLTNNGIIQGLGAGGTGSNPEGVSIGGGTVVNNSGASIIGQNNSGTAALGNGLLVDDSNNGNAFAAATITNSGTIRGYTGFGVKIVSAFNNTVTNNAGGTIRGGGTDAAVQMGSAVDTLNNSGSIISDTGVAVDLGGGDDTLNITGGSASITGSVSGGAGSNSAMINPGAGQSFNYSGALSNFATVEVKSGAVKFSGTNTYDGTTSVTGGKLTVANNTALGTTAGGTSVSSGAALALDGTAGNLAIGAEDLTLNGAGVTGAAAGALQNVAGANAYAGLVTLGSATTLQSDAGSLALTNTGTITGSGFGLTLNGSGNGSIASVIGTGTGSLTKNGSGTWTLTGANTYTGGTMITGGTLLITSTAALGSGAVNISGGGTLTNGGTGNLNFSHNVTNNGTINSGGHNVVFGGSTTVNGNGALTGGGTFTVMGIISPGNSPGTVPVGAGTTLTIDGGATTIWQLNALVDNSNGIAGVGGNWDNFVLNPTAAVNVAGTLQIALDGISFSNDPYWQTNHSYTLFSGGGTINGGFTTITGDFTYTNAYGTGIFSRSGDMINYTFGPVPEPQTWALAALGLTAVLFRLRRMAKRN